MVEIGRCLRILVLLWLPFHAAAADADLNRDTGPWSASPGRSCGFGERSTPFGCVPESGAPPLRTFEPTEPPEWLDNGSTRPYWRRNLFKRVLQDQVFLITQWWPAEGRRVEFSVPFVVVLAGAAESSDGGLDMRLSDSLADWTADGRSNVAHALSRLGNTESGVLLLGTGYLVSRWTGNEHMSRTASLATEALINAGIYSSLFKRLTRRTRPSSGGTGEFFVGHPENGQEATSFPSGHATGVFAVATVFAAEYRDRRWVPWFAYGTASLISLSRVGLRRHFPTDVLAGAILGRSLAKMVLHRDGFDRELRPVSRFQPLFNERNGGFGVTYTYTW